MRKMSIFFVLVGFCVAVFPIDADSSVVGIPVVTPPPQCPGCYWGSDSIEIGAGFADDAYLSFIVNNTCNSLPYLSWGQLFSCAHTYGVEAADELFDASNGCDCELAEDGLEDAEYAMICVSLLLDYSSSHCEQVDSWVNDILSASYRYDVGIDLAEDCVYQSCGDID